MTMPSLVTLFKLVAPPSLPPFISISIWYIFISDYITIWNASPYLSIASLPLMEAAKGKAFLFTFFLLLHPPYPQT